MKGESIMYVHVEYDDFGEYVEVLDESAEKAAKSNSRYEVRIQKCTFSV